MTTPKPTTEQKINGDKKHYHLENIRALLTNGFDKEKLLEFCAQTAAFNQFYQQLPNGINHHNLVERLIDYCQSEELVFTLLSLAKGFLALETYNRFKPYVKEKRSGRLLNPFHYGGPVPPESFIGHRWAVDFCQTKLSSPRPANIAISGERRIGKTSLLHYLHTIGAQEEWGQRHLYVYLDCAIFVGNFTPTAFWREVLNHLEDKLFPSSPLLNQITQLQQLDDLKHTHLRQFFREYYQHYPGRAVILLLDEFEQLVENYNQETQNLLYNLRSLSQTAPRKFTMITATRDSLSHVCRPITQTTGLEIHSGFVPCQLDLFDRSETETVVQTLLQKTGVEFKAKELELIWELSQWQNRGALPIFVQVAASLIFEYKRKYDSLTDYAYLERQFEQQTQLYRDDTPANPPISAELRSQVPPTVFISYSRQDETEKDKFVSHLKALKQIDLIEIWSDDEQISAGEDWEAKINEAIEQAEVAVLLITANFLSSDYVQNEQLPALLNKRQQKKMTIIPVIVRACAWHHIEWLAAMDIRPKEGRPVWADGESHVDEDLAAIAEEIATLITGKAPPLRHG